MRLLVRSPSLWLAYDLTRPEEVAKLLPPHLRLASVPLFEKERAPYRPKLLMNSYDVQSLWMRGHRLEIQTIAKDVKRNTIHFVILQCLSNVNLWDPLAGVAPPNALCVRKHTRDVYNLRISSSEPDPTLSPRHRFNSPTRRRGLRVLGDMTAPTSLTNVSSRFVVDANHECYFGTHPFPFPLTFSVHEVSRPVRKLSNTRVQNTLWTGVRREQPSHVFVHEHDMAYDVDVQGMWYDFF